MIKDIKLKLGGKNRVFSFGLFFIGNVLERLDIDYHTMLEKVSKNPFKYAPILMAESLKNTYSKEKKEVDFTDNDIIEWLEKEDLLGVDSMLKFINAFLGTQENKTPLNEADNDKKVSKKK